ncbi:Outer membrane lipoprotein omp10 precursor [Liberibacter crescens BT-1]|uniref:Outer membrane lipoprotein omp10 n=1 Tax=Liberibacter crescens (strain BT-1) TaxID=1215343 RepID=L0EVA3_LIBCB|nr:hypothetical protein [Liberibacter crescens]AGA64573.1 Outer membrane lipoprotein omp10 precursor [Liberibacter crescens BT-1]
MKVPTRVVMTTFAFAVTACSSLNNNLQQHSSVHKSFIEGIWEDQNGIISTFQSDGTFKTHSTDGSNTTLATGFYRQTSATEVDIDMTSLVRNSLQRIHCSLVKEEKLSCTSENNSHFSLSRSKFTPPPNNPLSLSSPQNPPQVSQDTTQILSSGTQTTQTTQSSHGIPTAPSPDMPPPSQSQIED